MNEQKCDKIYSNRATVVAAQKHISCEHCSEPLVFAMRDNTHEFSIGLSTIIQCLNVAEKEGYVPKLSSDWWIEVGISLEE